MEKIMKNLDAIKDEMQDSLITLLKIPSIMNEGENGTLFGSAIQESLEVTMKLCDDLGFKTYTDPEGYYGYAEIGEGKELLGVLGHLDVVPVGDLAKWNTDPFEPTIKNGNLYARGASDDKGPTILALYAVKALMNSGHKFNRRVRFIFGTDEESLWRCIDKYTSKEEIPVMAFTPDSAFPVVYAEKGLIQYKLTSKNDGNIKFEGGDAMNSVPSSATYDGEKIDEVKASLKKLGFEFDDNGKSITVKGKAIHSKDSQNGINAIIRLLLAMDDAGMKSKEIDFIKMWKEDAFAPNVFGEMKDEPTGNVTINLGKAAFKNGSSELSVDIRFPVKYTKEDVTAALTKAAEKFDIAVKQHDYLRPVFMPLDGELVSTLISTYQEVTGDTKTQPIASGGATYARAMENCVAFGANFPGKEKTEHQPNEYINIERAHKAMEIYAKAIHSLTKG